MAKSVRTLSVYINLNSKEFTKGVRRLERRLKRLGKRIKNIGSNLTHNITVPMALAGAGAIKLASDFNASMTKIQTLVGASGDEVEKLKSQVLELAGKTAQAPKDLADGLFFIQSAGFKGKESLEALEVSAKGAAMGMGELTDIANATTSIMTAYAHENMSAAQAGDLLHETLKQGKFEAGEFMNKIGQVLPTAASFGISFEQLGSSIATMSKLSGDAAGSLTAVNQLMMKLNAPSEQQLDILNKLFGSYDNLSKSLKSDFMGTLNQIFTGLEGNDLALTKVFGSAKAVKAAFATAGLQSEVYAEVLDGMNESLGNVNNGFKVVSETSAFKFNKALASLKVAGIQLGTLIMPIVTKITEKISELIQKFSNLSDTAKKRLIIVAGAFALLGPAVSIIGSLTTGIGMLVPVITSLARGMVTLMTSLAPVVLLFLKWVGIIAGVWAGINFMIGNFKQLWNSGKFVVNSLNNLFLGLGEVIANVFDAEKRKEAFDKLLDELNKGWQDFKGDTKENIKETAEAIMKPIEIIVEKGKEFGGKFVENFKDGVQRIKGNIFDTIFEMDGGGGAPQDNENKKEFGAVSIKLLPIDSNFELIPPEPLQKAKQQLETFSQETKQTFTDTFSQMTETLQGFASNYTESFSEMVSTTIVEGGNMAEAFAGFMRQMIKEITAMIIKMMVFKALMSAFGIPTGGGGGVGIGKMIDNIFGFSKGGIVTSPVMGIVGEGRNINASNPEIIAPLSDLRKHLGAGGGRLHGSIYGNDILLSNTRTTITQDRIGGSVTNF